jgi:hypothetical protein
MDKGSSHSFMQKMIFLAAVLLDGIPEYGNVDIDGHGIMRLRS